jgi:hypothetical protein
MPFCRAMLSAKRFIAGVGGNVPGPLPTAAPSKGGPPAAAPSLSLPMIRSATLLAASPVEGPVLTLAWPRWSAQQLSQSL